MHSNRFSSARSSVFSRRTYEKCSKDVSHYRGTALDALCVRRHKWGPAEACHKEERSDTRKKKQLTVSLGSTLSAQKRAAQWSVATKDLESVKKIAL